jgi:IS30 family transposase
MDQIASLAEIGLTVREIAACLQVSQSTLYRRMEETEFRDAYEQGQARASASVKRILFKKAIDEENINALFHLSDRICWPKRKAISEDELNKAVIKDLPPPKVNLTPEKIAYFQAEFDRLY